MGIFIKASKYLLSFAGLFIHLGLVQLLLLSQENSGSGLVLNNWFAIQLGLFVIVLFSIFIKGINKNYLLVSLLAHCFIDLRVIFSFYIPFVYINAPEKIAFIQTIILLVISIVLSLSLIVEKVRKHVGVTY